MFRITHTSTDPALSAATYVSEEKDTVGTVGIGKQIHAVVLANTNALTTLWFIHIIDYHMCSMRNNEDRLDATNHSNVYNEVLIWNLTYPIICNSEGEVVNSISSIKLNNLTSQSFKVSWRSCYYKLVVRCGSWVGKYQIYTCSIIFGTD